MWYVCSVALGGEVWCHRVVLFDPGISGLWGGVVLVSDFRKGLLSPFASLRPRCHP